MAIDVAALNDKITALKGSVDALISLASNPPPSDLQPVADAIDNLKIEIDAKLAAVAAA